MRPRIETSFGSMDPTGSPTVTSASSPALRISVASSFFASVTASSMRAGWMRPSLMSASSARLATWRRMGENPLIVIAPGVSSTIISVPVSISIALMLRPSFPMMRPFMSSLGRITEVVVVSTHWLDAKRVMASDSSLRLCFSISSSSTCSHLRSRDMSASDAVFSTSVSNRVSASSFDSLAISCSFAPCSSLIV